MNKLCLAAVLVAVSGFVALPSSGAQAMAVGIAKSATSPIPTLNQNNPVTDVSYRRYCKRWYSARRHRWFTSCRHRYHYQPYSYYYEPDYYLGYYPQPYYYQPYYYPGFSFSFGGFGEHHHHHHHWKNW